MRIAAGCSFIYGHKKGTACTNGMPFPFAAGGWKDGLGTEKKHITGCAFDFQLVAAQRFELRTLRV